MTDNKIQDLINEFNCAKQIREQMFFEAEPNLRKQYERGMQEELSDDLRSSLYIKFGVVLYSRLCMKLKKDLLF